MVTSFKPSVRIVTDSACDITPEEAQVLDIDVLPLKTVFSDGDYRDGIDLTATQFFEKLIETGEMPSTCQVAPFAFDEAFRQALAHDQDVVCVSLGSKLSGTIQSAHIAKQGLTEEEQARIFVVDTENVTIGEQLLVRLAVQLRDSGRSAGEIVAEVEKQKENVRVVALLDTLEYLKKGGRISSGAALAGSLLSIKPVICVEDGEVRVIGKARGSKNGQNQLIKSIERYDGVDTSMPFRLAYSGLSNQLLKKYWADNRELYAGWQGEPPVTSIGAVIGTHVGPGAIAVSFFSKN